MEKLRCTIAYLKARLGETSTWAGISTAIMGAAAFEGWEKTALIVLGIIGVFVPTTKSSAGDDTNA
jgi:hypothetical protein